MLNLSATFMSLIIFCCTIVNKIKVIMFMLILKQQSIAINDLLNSNYMINN